jgi:hypothetical protein
LRTHTPRFCWWIREDGTCACGRPGCKDAGKHPIGSLAPHGFKDATTDENTIGRWWTQYPQANIGVACGPSGLLVADLDVKPDEGVDGTPAWQRLQSEHGQAPETLVQASGSGQGGRHYIFDRKAFEGYIKSTDGAAGTDQKGLDIRADGGYFIADPSNHKSGGRYKRLNPETPIAQVPAWLCEWAASRGSSRTKSDGPNEQKGGPTHKTTTGPADVDEEARIVSMLKCLPQDVAERREKVKDDKGEWLLGWLEINAALFESGLENARELADEWSMGSERYGGEHGFPGSDKYDQAGQEKLWRSFERRYERAKITLRTLEWHARHRCGWVDPKRVYHQTGTASTSAMLSSGGSGSSGRRAAGSSMTTSRSSGWRRRPSKPCTAKPASSPAIAKELLFADMPLKAKP